MKLSLLKLINRQLAYARRNLSSFLFIPRVVNSEVKQVPAILPPQLFHLFNPDEIDNYEHNLKARNLPQLDWPKISCQWREIFQLKIELQNLEKLRQDAKRLVEEKIESGTKFESVEELIEEARKVRRRHKSIYKSIIDLEESVVPKVLGLPNRLHPNVPLVDCEIEYVSDTNLPDLEYSPKSHLEIGSSFNYLKFTDLNPEAYYLIGRLAAVELATLDYFAQSFLQHDFIRSSNPDICNAVIVEGSGIDVNNPLISYQLEDHDPNMSTEHLTGSASLSAFCAYFAKHAVNSSQLPTKYFAIGRNYKPAVINESPNLFNVNQSSQLYCFIPYIDDNSLVFDETLHILCKCFNELELHYRVVEISASKLLSAETRRTEIQMWSPFTQTYHTVSAISDYSDFIAKRLWMCYKSGSKYGFINVVGASGISLPPFLACLMENCQSENGDFRIPNALQSYVTRFY